MRYESEAPLETNIQWLKARHPDLTIQRTGEARNMQEAHRTLRNKQAGVITKVLTPLWMLQEQTHEDRVALTATRDAGDLLLPILFERRENPARNGHAYIVARHFDFGDKLSQSEVHLVDEIARTAAQKLDQDLGLLSVPLTYGLA